MPIILGLLKGIIIGGGLGFGFAQLGPSLQGGVLAYLFFALVGALVGFVAGKPFWKHATIWTPVFKGVFGAILFAGIYALVSHFLAVKVLDSAPLGLGPLTLATPLVLGPALGVLFAIFFEWDDSREDPQDKKK